MDIRAAHQVFCAISIVLRSPMHEVLIGHAFPMAWLTNH